MKAEDRYKHVIKEYSRRAAQYDLSCQKFISASQAVAIEMLNPKRGEKILDAGCGTGSAIASIAKNIGENGEIVGIDLCDEMLNVAKERLSQHKKITLIKGNLEDISYPDDYFDAAICVNVMHYFDNLMSALKELHRLLKPEGRLILVGFCTDYFFFGLMERIWRIFIPSHIRAHSFKQLSEKVKQAGFEIAEGKRFKIGWFWRSMVIKVRKG